MKRRFLSVFSISHMNFFQSPLQAMLDNSLGDCYFKCIVVSVSWTENCHLSLLRVLLLSKTEEKSRKSFLITIVLKLTRNITNPILFFHWCGRALKLQAAFSISDNSWFLRLYYSFSEQDCKLWVNWRRRLRRFHTLKMKCHWILFIHLEYFRKLNFHYGFVALVSMPQLIPMRKIICVKHSLQANTHTEMAEWMHGLSVLGSFLASWFFW